MDTGPPTLNPSFASLRRFSQQREARERCEMCSAPLGKDHAHLLEPRRRQIVCACDPCAMLFSGQADTKYRRIPRRIRFLKGFQLTDAQWDHLLIPINMAFFHRSSPEKRIVAMYPSPAGATESLLDFSSWDDIVADNPILQEMEPDVEALLVNRLRGGPTAPAHFVVPIDECYKLVGIIRARWSGLSGGKEVWREIANFFELLKEKSIPV